MSAALTRRAPGFTRRQRAALPGSAYDRFVGVLKIVLPLAALALLAMIVIWPLTHAQEFSFLLSKDKVAMSKERLRVDNAIYRGETTRHQPFIIRARGAVQHSSAVPVVELDRLSADLRLDSGPATVTAPTGRYDMSKDRLDIAGPVRLDSAGGYTLDGANVEVSLVDRTVASDTAVSGTIPLGTFRANALRADIGGRVVVLTGAVHLRIVPGSRKRRA